jgi:hypothetical protein
MTKWSFLLIISHVLCILTALHCTILLALHRCQTHPGPRTTLVLSLEVGMHRGPRIMLGQVMRNHPLEVAIRLQFSPLVHAGHIPCLHPNLGDPVLLISMTL